MAMAQGGEAHEVALVGDDGALYDTGMTWEQAMMLNTVSETCPQWTDVRQKRVGDAAYAFMDRPHSFVDEWRLIWVVTIEMGVLMWTKDGVIINEPDDGVPNGFQPWDTFLSEWEEGYYEVAMPDQAPAPEPPPAPQPTNAATGPEPAVPPVQEEVQHTEVEDERETPPELAVDYAEEYVCGRRVQMAFGSATCWYGGLCAGECPKSKHIVFGFDDGEMREFPAAELNEQIHTGHCRFPQEGSEQYGTVEGATGPNVGMASAFTYFQESKKLRRVAGVLVGKTNDMLLQEPLYTQHFVCSSVFPQAEGSAEGPGRRRRSGVPSGGPSQQDRLGFHTFRRRETL